MGKSNSFLKDTDFRLAIGLLPGTKGIKSSVIISVHATCSNAFSRPLASPGVKNAVHIFGAGVYPQELAIRWLHADRPCHAGGRA
jgi:hypothetical protein